MVNLEQVKLLESKVIKAIEYVNQITEENNLLRGKLETYQKRIDELEVVVKRFKEDQSRIEEGIVSALDRLNQFETAIESSIAPIVTSAPPKEVFHQEREGPKPPAGNTPVGETGGQSGAAYAPAEEEPDDETDDSFIFGSETKETEGLTGDEGADPPGEAVDLGELDIF
jgi:hypothetical protein